MSGKAVSVTALQQLVAAGKITPEDIAAKVKSGEIELHDDRATAAASPKTQVAEGTPAPEDGMMTKAMKAGASLNPIDLTIGQAKGVAETGYNLYKGVANAVQGQPADTVRDPKIEEALKAKTLGEGVGKFGERAVEFAAGEGGANALAKGTGLLARIVKGAAVGGAVTKAQGGSDEAAGVNAVTGGLLGPVLEKTGEGLKWLGTKLTAKQISATAADDAAGFSVDTLNKYGVAKSTMGRTLDAVHQKITDLANQLRTITKGTPGDIDLHGVIADLKNELLSRAGRVANGANVENIENAIAKLEAEAQGLGGHVSVDEAQTLKRTVGVKGAWAYGKSDADTAMETVANAYTKRLRQAIEDATPNNQVKAINDQLGELMPVERAIIRRMPVKARQGDLDLKDIALLATGHPALAAAHIATNSMAGATAAYAVGKGLQGAARAIVRGAQAAVSGSTGGE